MRLLNLRYHKRFQMEVDLRRWRRTPVAVYPEYGLALWSPDLLHEHAEVKYLSFRDELDAVVFPCLGEMQSCLRLMEEIADQDLPAGMSVVRAPLPPASACVPRFRVERDGVAVLAGAHNVGLSEVVIVGFTDDGKEYFASSISDAGQSMYHLQRGIYRLNKTMDQEHESRDGPSAA